MKFNYFDFSKKGQEEFYKDANRRILETKLSVGTDDEKRKNILMIEKNLKKYEFMRQEYFRQLNILVKLKKNYEIKKKWEEFFLNIKTKETNELGEKIKGFENFLKKMSSNYKKDLERTIKFEENPFPDYIMN